jgi:hypothetical protein
VIDRQCGLVNKFAVRLLVCAAGAAAGEVAAVAVFGTLVPWQAAAVVFLLGAVTMTRTPRQAGLMLVLTAPWFGYTLGKAWQANGFGPEAVLCALSVMALVAYVRLAYQPPPRRPARAWLRFARGVAVPVMLVPYACRRCDALHVTAFGEGGKVLLTGRGDYTVVFFPPTANVRVSLHERTDEHGAQWLLPLPVDAAS